MYFDLKIYFNLKYPKIFWNSEIVCVRIASLIITMKLSWDEYIISLCQLD